MSFAISSVVLQFGGMITSAIGSSQAARSEQLNLQGRSIIADANAAMALSAGSAAAAAASSAGSTAAANVAAKAEEDVVKIGKEVGKIKSTQRARMAAAGLDLSEGTPVEQQASTDVLAWDEIDSVRANAARTAWGYSSQASAQAASIMAGAQAQSFNYSMEANAMRGSADSISPRSAGFSSLLGNAAPVAEKWYGLYKTGALSGFGF